MAMRFFFQRKDGNSSVFAANLDAIPCFKAEVCQPLSLEHDGGRGLVVVAAHFVYREISFCFHFSPFLNKRVTIAPYNEVIG